MAANKEEPKIQFWLTTDSNGDRYIHPIKRKPYRSREGNIWFNMSHWYLKLTDAFLESFSAIQQEVKDEPYLLEVTVKKLKPEPKTNKVQ